jgi:hypothetical protein
MMATRIMRIVGTAFLGLLVAASAQAQGRNHGKDKGRERAVVVRRDNNRENVFVRRDNRPQNVIVRRTDSRPRTVIVQRNDNRPRNVIVQRIDNRPRTVIVRRDNDRFDRDRDYRYVRGGPPGLMKKPGHMPPGQYKKYYRAYYGADVLSREMRRRHYRVVRIVPAGEARYVYYQPYYGPNYYGDEQWVLVRPGADRLYFDNAPASILQAVLAQLY